MKRYVADLACLTPEWTEWISEQLGYAPEMQLAGPRRMGTGAAARQPHHAVTTDRDAAGVPRIELHWTKDALDHRTLLEGLRLFGETIAASDIGRLRISDWVLDGSPYPDGMELAGNHHMGGTRMSADASPAWSTPTARCTAWRTSSSAARRSSPPAASARRRRRSPRLALRLGDHLSRVVSS